VVDARIFMVGETIEETRRWGKHD